MTYKQDNSGGFNRRESLAAVGALVVGGGVGYKLNDKAPKVVVRTRTVQVPEENALKADTASTADQNVQTFVSRPDLRPPAMTVTNFDPSALAGTPKHIVLGLKTAPPAPDAQTGPMVIDNQGRLVWFEPYTNSIFDANVQSYEGKPVLTFWSGDVVDGHGKGSALVLDQGYGQFISIGHADGLQIDLHELNLTAQGTALVTAYSQQVVDLTSVGGAKKGKLIVGHAFEIDLATGAVVWSWNSLQHVGVAESYVGAPKSGSTPYDYFHINSISPTTDGNFLISGRSCSTIYKVSRKTGKIIWRLNGKKSDFKVAADAVFSFQHHTRQVSNGAQISVFDNVTMNPLNPGMRSRGLLLNVNESTRKVTLAQDFLYPAAFISMTQGSVQLLDDGKVFVGWGSQPYFSLFSASGELLTSGELAQGLRSYRAYAVDWTGQPDPAPSAVAKQAGTGGFVVYASWNGATEIHHWAIMAGADADHLVEVGSQRWSGFETAIVVNSAGPAFQAVAVDKNNKVLGRSAVL
jgi:Arylsulfotransferase (ASST)